MKIALASDHAAAELREVIRSHLESRGLEPVVYDTTVPRPTDDYPVYADMAARAVAKGECDLGILICGTGIGMSLAANKVKGIRAVFADRVEFAELGRQHNDARCVAMGGRFVTPELGLEIARAFLTTPFSGDERHARRIAELEQYEQTGSLA
ncbi:putative sugar phosphate isomerase YwlF [bioreactor metagenome]|uniref:Putative sugar phosphate isomerase YwlF n=1 Tax=bioreactor metagenome TaxID=1076179 RepID=A0A645HYY0_9ZZZZ